MSMLAVVLIGFSVAAYFLTDKYLYQRAQERLTAALNTLNAVAEVGSDGIEWDPAGRHLTLESNALDEPILWVVRDPLWYVVDRSQEKGIDAFLMGVAEYRRSFNNSPGFRTGKWLVGQRLIHAESNVRATDSIPLDSDDDEVKYSMLAITAGVSLDPVRTSLRQLAIMLLVLSL